MAVFHQHGINYDCSLSPRKATTTTSIKRRNMLDFCDFSQGVPTLLTSMMAIAAPSEDFSPLAA